MEVSFSGGETLKRGVISESKMVDSIFFSFSFSFLFLFLFIFYFELQIRC